MEGRLGFGGLDWFKGTLLTKLGETGQASVLSASDNYMLHIFLNKKEYGKRLVHWYLFSDV